MLNPSSSLQSSSLPVFANTNPEFDFAKADVERLAETINNFKDHQGQGLFGIGCTLIEAKKLLAHGEWLGFLRDHRVAFGSRQAEKIMAIARAEDGIQLARLGVSKATLLLGLSLEQRTKLIASGEAETLSVGKLREQISTLKGLSQKLKKPKKILAKVVWAAGILHLDPTTTTTTAINSGYDLLAQIFQFSGEDGCIEAGRFLLNLNQARELLLRHLEDGAGTENNTLQPNKEI
jgi:hypothetical protein